ncbi:hypothetical protein [Thermococcus prieurii]
MGIIAGVVQEIVKFLFLRGHSAVFGASFGFGFGTAEVIMLLPLVFMDEDILEEMSERFSMPLPKLSLTGLVERHFAVMFHVGTSMLLTGGSLPVLLALAVLHSIVDGLGNLGNIGKIDVKKFETFFGFVSISVFLIAVR